MIRAERRRWEQENWPYWKSLVRYRKHERQSPSRPGLLPRWTHSDQRSAAEQETLIDAILEDLDRIEKKETPAGVAEAS